MAVLTSAFDNLLGYQMRRATAVLMADFVRTLSDFDMRPAEVTTLLVIAENPDCSQSEVGEAIAIKRANMVPIIARLIERDLVARTRVDGRSLALRVTEKGADLAAEAWRRIAEHEARFRDRLAPADLETVLAALPVLRTAIDDAPSVGEQ
ncbi:MAG: MarR family transcriptional regulator [Novosphingobium sp.]|uniref:MarR family winged helix-turn-helix transcriptional regulator n=1 Tax=Novosphingobium sp. NDB2Meth1 TaxID=1892847 RepID=UPI0009311B20|nr:MarR family transcriptional regulator [Novosphingobium sp. NDB2Meth1]MBY0394362.1 MarR family transcriptional regulator [Novosphingobium sp.]